MDLSLRPATAADAAPIIDAINIICAEGGAFVVSEFISTPQWHSALYQPVEDPNLLLLIAEVDRSIAGVGNLFRLHEKTLSVHVSELGIFVPKAFRRQGIGRLLMQEMLAWAKTCGIEKVVLHVFATNLGAIALYQNFGFVEEGCQKRQIRQGEQYIDLLCMARFL